MNRWILSAAVGVISGITAVRMALIPVQWSPSIFLAGIIILILSLILLAAGKASWMLSFGAFTCLGITVTAHHLTISVPGHLSEAVRIVQGERPVSLEGIVIRPPDARDLYTIAPLKVISLKDFGGNPVPVNRGLVYTKIYPSAGDLRSSIKYGDRIQLRSVFLKPPVASANPGSFDMKAFLNNQGYFATVTVRKGDQIERMESGAGNPLIQLSEQIKNHILITIKQTLPYPESSFLGGVLLGLRSGLSSEIQNNFRAAGVSHVLAVSGLHVTIITLFFMGFFKVLRLPRTPTFILIISALILFTLITGARPSTVRAAIMNGVTILFVYFRGIRLDRSLLMGISIAAIFILLQNPLLLTEASFLFSFSAVLSLALLTRPVHQLLSRCLRNTFSVFLFLGVLTASGALFAMPWQDFIRSRSLAYGAVLIILAAVADRLIPMRTAFRHWPVWLSTFFAAQVAIQLGMIPLTVIFFKKFSIAAPMANFIAIPLIGVIVQLGLFAGILGFIPAIGTGLALCLNASNWLLIKIFLASATFFGTRFPYPDVAPPGIKFILPYYSALLIFAFWQPIRSTLAPRLRFTMSNINRLPVLIRILLMAVPSVFLTVRAVDMLKPDAPRCSITFLDPAMYGMGGGNAVLIRTPDGKFFLIDAGPRYALRQDKPVDVDIGRRVVVPALLELHADDLEGLVLTCADSQNAGGIESILNNEWIKVDAVYHGLPFTSLSNDESSDDILKRLDDPELFQGNNRRRAELTAWALRDMFSAILAKSISVRQVHQDQILYETDRCGNRVIPPFRIRVLNPPLDRYSGAYSTWANSIVLSVEFGDCRILLNSNAGRIVQESIMNRGEPRAQVIQLAANGSESALNPEFLSEARAVVVVPQTSRWAQRNLVRVQEIIRRMDIEFFSTASGGAVTVSTDGTGLTIVQQNEPVPRVLEP